MAQYKTGTVEVTNGSTVVTGTSTTWVTSLITAGYSFLVTIANGGDGILYDVASVDSETQITLTTVYNGDTNATALYAIQKDYTSPDNIPELTNGDVGMAAIFTRAMRVIQSSISSFLSASDIGVTVQGYDADTVIDADYVATDNNYTTPEKTKLGYITVTQAVDLDAIELRVNELDAAVVLVGEWDASVGTFPGAGIAESGWSYIVSVGGTVDGVVFTAEDRIVALTDNASTSVYASNWHHLDYTDQVSSVAGRTGAVVITASDLADFADGIADGIHGASAKTTLVDADELGLSDSAATWGIKKVTWANVKATLETYFDSVYAAIVHRHETDEIDLSNIIGSPTHADTLDRTLDHIYSAGIVDGGAVTDNTDGTVAITSGECFIRATDDSHVALIYATFTANSSITLTDNATNYIYVDYNSGSPIPGVTLDPTTINMTTRIAGAVVTREDSHLHILDVGDDSVDANAKLRKRLFYTETFKRTSGGIISNPSALYLGCTEAQFYFGLTLLDLPALDTSGADTFMYYYTTDGTTWVHNDTSSSLSNTQYNDVNSGLVTLGNNQYMNHWIYAAMSSGGATHYTVVYGQDEFTSVANASNEAPPVIVPPAIKVVGILLGVITTQEGSSVVHRVDTSFTETFNTAQVTSHTELTDIGVTSHAAIDTHVGLTDEHINWTSDQGATNIHTGNYVNTTYSVGDGGLTEINFTTTIRDNIASINTINTFTLQQNFKEISETVYSLTGTVIDPANGTIQYKTLGSNTTFTESLEDGQSVTLQIDDGTVYTITWPTMTWVGGSAPTLPTTGYAVIVIWQVAGVVYGLHTGNV